jgi:hypothetical protein
VDLTPVGKCPIRAGVLWIGGDLAGLPFLVAIFTRMMYEDQRHAAAIDAELDALEAASTPGTPTQATLPTVQAEPRPQARLWWEDHPELAQRLRRQR